MVLCRIICIVKLKYINSKAHFLLPRINLICKQTIRVRWLYHLEAPSYLCSNTTIPASHASPNFLLTPKSQCDYPIPRYVHLDIQNADISQGQ